MKQNISHHMTESPHTVKSNQTVAQARDLMNQYGYHHLPVMDNGKIVGILTERDLRVVELLHADHKAHVADVMNTSPYFVEPTMPVAEVLDIMLSKGLSSVLVKGTASSEWGLFTTTDALRLLRVLI